MALGVREITEYDEHGEIISREFYVVNGNGKSLAGPFHSLGNH